MTRPLTLIESYSSLPAIAPATHIVSLTPRASFLLSEKNIPYECLESHYTESQLQGDDESFFYDQWAWFQRFDHFLCENFEEARTYSMGLATAHYNRIKYLADSFILRSQMLRSLIEDMRPSTVTIYYDENQTDSPASIFNFKRNDRYSFVPILKCYATEHPDIRFNFIPIPKTSGSSSRSSKPSRLNSFHSLLKRIRNLFAFNKWQSLFQDKVEGAVLVLDSGVDAIDTITKKLVQKGCRVFFKQSSEIKEISRWLEPSFSLSPSDDKCKDIWQSLVREGETASSIFVKSSLQSWINQKAGIDLTNLFEPYWRHFLTTVCPETLYQADHLSSLIEQQGIRAIIARASAGENYPAALMAGAKKHIPRFCFQHSVGPLDMKGWVVPELHFFDFNFAISTPAADYFRAQANLPFLNACQVLESSHYLHALQSRFQKKRQATDSQTLVYVPCKIPYRGLRHRNTCFYPLTWYFEHQRKVLSFLATRKDYHVIYKHTPGQEWSDHSVIPWIEAQAFSNITVHKGLFVDYIKQADRVLFDYPSTGLFEAAAVGLPVMSLYHKDWKIWPAMAPVFGNSLQFFSTSEDACVKIASYLDRPANDFLVSLPLAEDGDIVQTLTDLIQGFKVHEAAFPANKNVTIPTAKTKV